MILGPLSGGVLYTQWGHFEVYGSGSLFIVLAIISVVVAIPALRRHKEEMETPA
jgi:MFS family permease